MALIQESERQHLNALYHCRPRANSTSSTTPSNSSRDSSETRARRYRQQLRKQSSPAYLSAGQPNTTKSTPSPVRSVNAGSSSHHRSQSVKIPRKHTQPKPHRPAPLNLDQLKFESLHPRNSISQNRAEWDFKGHDDRDSNGVYRLRNFSVTSRGVINQGDSYRARSASALNTPVHGTFTEFPRSEQRLSVSSAYSTGEPSLTGSGETNSSQNPRYRVLMTGALGVGKTALTNQFLTSEYTNAYDSSFTGRSI